MMMKPSCSWCKDYEQFEENKQLSILVNCYKKLCEYITQATLARDIIEAVDCSSDILALLNDGSLFCEETEKPSDSSFTLCLTHSPLPSTSEPTADPQASLSPMSESTLSIAIGSSVINGLPTYNGLSIDRFGINIPSPEHPNTIDVCNTVDIKTEDLSDNLPPVCDTVATDLCSTGIDICSFSEDIKPGDSLLLSVEEVLRSLETVSNTEVCCPNLQPNLEATVSNGPFLQLSSQSLSHNVFMSTSPALHGLSCTAATQNPSVLTCRGQRCPCYSNRKACLDCICRGCQNSYMANGEKKLEAFAVPEKALEQTRLTLGINVTSIAVRNASTSTSVINVTGSPVTTFLAASTHDDKSLDEAIDMRFDC